MGLINNELNKLKDSDILNLILFALSKLNNTSEYSAISELAYILDKENLFKLCEYFGGLTITIPTIQELEALLNGLLLYKYVNIDNLTLDDALNQLRENINLKAVKKCYFELVELLDNYSFTSRGKLW